MVKRILIVLTFVASFASVYGQADADAVTLADEMYGFGAKKDALEVYLQAANLNPKNAKACYMAGKCYQETTDKGKSVKYLEKAYKLDPNISPDILYFIAKGYQFDAKFDKAIENFNLYIAGVDTIKNPKGAEHLKKAKKHIDECNCGKILYKQRAAKQLINLGKLINTEYEEYTPVITSDESTMFFTSRREGSTGNKKDVDNEFFEDVYVSKKDKDGKWGRPENMGPTINSEVHEACNGISADGKELYIYRETHGGDIYKCTQLADGTWSLPERIEHINTKHEEASIAFSGDGKLMVFSSDRPDGVGELDLYFCSKNEQGIWSDPLNMGTTLNTAHDEDSPFLDKEGKTLYFSSAGFNTMGGYDIFKSSLVDGKWTYPVNLGVPVNTPDDDIYYVESSDGQRGYYSSVRNGGFGEKDLYMVVNAKTSQIPLDSIAESFADSTLKETKVVAKNKIHPKITKPTTEPIIPEAPSHFKSVTLKGRVFDSESGNPISGKVKILDEKGKMIQIVETSPDGYYSTILNEKKSRRLKVVAQIAGYLRKSLVVDIFPDSVETEIVKDITLEKYVTGKKYIVKNIYFDFEKASIKRVARSNKGVYTLRLFIMMWPKNYYLINDTIFRGAIQGIDLT